MKVFFTPYYDNNPYQKKIMEELSILGVDVKPAKTGGSEFFKTKGLKEADVIHFHWFEAFIKSSSFMKSFIKMIVFLSKLFFFKKNKKYVWTVHNLVNHEKKNVVLDKIFLFLFTKMMDVFCVHNEYAKQKILEFYSIKEDRVIVIHHGNYVNDYTTNQTIKNSFNIDDMGINTQKIIFTFLGHIRPYKGVLDLVKAFKDNPTKNKSQLLICGKVSTKQDLETINKAINGDENIIFKPGFVKDEHIEGYLNNSDVMVYPYKNILTSGALILGMSLKKACIASNVGSMTEFLDNKYIFNNINELTHLIKNLEQRTKEELSNIGTDNFKKIEKDTWSNMALELKKLYCN